MSTTTARTVTPLDFLRTSPARDTLDETYARYAELHDSGGAEARRAAYAVMVNAYYDLVTDFYEFGWGDAFHFAPRYRGESFLASLARHQHFLAHRLGVGAGAAVIDVGCGIGGPGRSIARFWTRWARKIDKPRGSKVAA